MSKEYGLYNDEPMMLTFTEKWVNLSNPSAESIDIIDIAHHLSYICRWNGAVKKYLSVAEHCCRGAEVAKAEHKFDVLMHDASEAYLGDVTSPLKRLLGKVYKDLEERFMKVISEKYGFKYPLIDHVKKVDVFLLEVEWNNHMLMVPKHDLTPWHPAVAEKKFLQLFKELKP
jgi:hypothetical protein